MESVAGSEFLHDPTDHEAWLEMGPATTVPPEPHMLSSLQTQEATSPSGPTASGRWKPSSFSGSIICLHFLIVQLLCRRMEIKRVLKEGSTLEKYKQLHEEPIWVQTWCLKLFQVGETGRWVFLPPPLCVNSSTVYSTVQAKILHSFLIPPFLSPAKT